jgi:6,7-dimethyl-8-ribityllumazine synthase
MSERYEQERFDPERLRRLQWDREGDESEPASPQATDEAPRSAPEAAPTELGLEVEEAVHGDAAGTDLDASSENVFDAWPGPSQEDVALPAARPEQLVSSQPAAVPKPEPEPQLEPEEPPLTVPVAAPEAASQQHAPGDLIVPPGFAVLEGEPRGERRAVGIVVSRFNGEVTTRLLEGALAELDSRGVARDAVTVMPVPGAFELPLAAMALAKTRRFACIVALGCVIRGDTPHFDYVAGEAASGLQLASIETGVPVAFGLLTLESADQAEQRIGKGAEAVVTALEMADVFANLRAAASR